MKQPSCNITGNRKKVEGGGGGARHGEGGMFITRTNLMNAILLGPTALLPTAKVLL